MKKTKDKIVVFLTEDEKHNGSVTSIMLTMGFVALVYLGAFIIFG